LRLQNNQLLLYALIFAGLTLLHIFIFRDVVAAIPALLSGDASIVREELVPFFNFGSQFWGDGASALTSSEEVRVSYSFWTAWVRYYQVLPFALIILNAVSAFLLFFSFHKLGRYFYKKSLFGVVAALLAALLIHTILLYAKIAHFYVLIIGFSMFALSLSLFLEQIFYKQKLEKKNIIIVSLLTLLNPAIHYHVIFYVVALLIIAIHMIFTVIMNRPFFWKYFRRNVAYFGVITLLSLVPYVIYIMLTTSSSMGDVSTQIPVNYWMIYYASLALPFVFSLDTAGHLDLMRHGNYLAPIPRFGTMVVMFLIGGLFIFKNWKRLHIVSNVMIMTLFIVMIFAMWMTIGYSDNSPYSFHKVFGDSAVFFAHMGSAIGDSIAGLMKTFINILRFPHRFQFIYFYAAGVLFMIALVWLREIMSRKMRISMATAFVTFIALFPIVANNDYRTALSSGDLASFVAPYRVPDDLKHIKTTLGQEKHEKLFILPTLESGRELMQDSERYSFLDKYLIYYLNEPTLYYGVGAKTENKLVSYLVYRAISYNESWWEDILANNLGITDILVPQHLRPREKGIAYLADIDTKIIKSLDKSSKYTKTFDGQDYKLYSLNKAPDTSASTLINMSWENTTRYLNGTKKTNSRMRFPLQIREYVKEDAKKQLLTDSVERSYYDFYAQWAGKNVFVPNPISLPFNSEYVASSNFTNNALSLGTLYSKTDAYNYLHENMPSLVGLQRPAFVGLTKGKVTLDMKLDAPESGKYRLLLHGASRANEIKAVIAGRDVTLQKIKDDRNSKADYLDTTYFYVDIDIEKGAIPIEIKNETQNAVIVGSLMLLSAAHVPGSFNEIRSPQLQIVPTGTKMTYDVTIKAGK
jgi:hypothetical protein